MNSVISCATLTSRIVLCRPLPVSRSRSLSLSPASSLIRLNSSFTSPLTTTTMVYDRQPKSSDSTPKTDDKSDDTKTDAQPLPPLSAQEYRVYNSMADMMENFHDRFRQSWNLLWKACTTNARPSKMTIRQFLDTGLTFADHLHLHHNIEEQVVFPKLAARMPEFRGDLQAQHKEIHKGLDGFTAYLKDCKAGEKDLDLKLLRSKMEGWGGVLWEHLDDEVRALGAENMRKYWSAEEVRRMRM